MVRDDPHLVHLLVLIGLPQGAVRRFFHFLLSQIDGFFVCFVGIIDHFFSLLQLMPKNEVQKTSRNTVGFIG